VAFRYAVTENVPRLSEASPTRRREVLYFIICVRVVDNTRVVEQYARNTRFYLGHGDIFFLSSSSSPSVNYNISRRNLRSISPARQPVEAGRNENRKKSFPKRNAVQTLFRAVRERRVNAIPVRVRSFNDNCFISRMAHH